MQYRKFIQDKFSIDEPKSGMLVPFEFRPIQNRYYDMLVRDYDIEKRGLAVPVREMVLKARRQGFSSFILALFAADDILSDNPSETLVISYRDDATAVFRKRYRNFILSTGALKAGADRREIQERPGFLDQFAKHVLSVDSGEFELRHNRARFYCGTANARVGGRGGVVQKLLFSESAFYPDSKERKAKEIIEGTLRQVDVDGGWAFTESTANGDLNHFAKMWQDAESGQSRFKPRFFGWRDYYTPEQFELIKSEFTDKRMVKQEYPECFTSDTRFSDKGGGVHVYADHPEHAKGMNDVWELKTKLGYSVKATENHLFRKPDDAWKPLKDLEIGERVKLLPPVFNAGYQEVEMELGLPILKHKMKIDERMAEFIGLYMGDGSMGKERNGTGYVLSLAFDRQDDDLVADFKERMVAYFGAARERVTGEKGGCIELRVSSKWLNGFADSLSLVRRNGNGGIKRRIHVPDYIRNSPRPVVAAFLRGLFEADGFCGYNHPRVAFFSKHEEFIQDVRLLLLGFGITCRLAIADKRAGDGHTYTGRQIELRKLEAERFMAEVGFLSRRKRVRWIGGRPKTTNPGCILPLLLEDEISSKSPAGREMVYDHEVLPERHYSANGFFVHNSAAEAFLSSGNRFFDPTLLENLRTEDGKVEGAWTFYDQYRPGHRYALGADVSEGVGRHNSTIVVLDFDAQFTIEGRTWKKPKVVAVYCSNKIAPDTFAHEIVSGGNRYGSCIAAPERNNHGFATLAILKDRYFNLYKTPDDKLGWHTNSASKPRMLHELRTALHEGLIEISDRALKMELMGYPQQDLNTANVDEEDETQGHYDRTIALAIAWQMRSLATPSMAYEHFDEEHRQFQPVGDFDPHSPFATV